MKERILSILTFIFILTSFQGCLPDSFKKFKQDPPQSQAAPTPEEEEEEQEQQDDDEDETSDFPQEPSFFEYTPGFYNTLDIDLQTFIYPVGEGIDPLHPKFDGALAELDGTPDPIVEEYEGLDPRFELFNPSQNSVTQAHYQNWAAQTGDHCPDVLDSQPAAYTTSLPPGFQLNDKTGRIIAMPSEISATIDGQPRDYCIQFRHTREDGSHVYYFTALKVGVYEPLPTNSTFSYTTGDRMTLELTDFQGSIEDFVIGNSIYTTDGGEAEITFVSQSTNTIYVNKNGSTVELSEGRPIDTRAPGESYLTKMATINDSTEIYMTGDDILKEVIEADPTGIISQRNSVRFFLDIEIPPTLDFYQEWITTPGGDVNTGGSFDGSIDAPLNRTLFNVKAINRLHPDWSDDGSTDYDDIGGNEVLRGNFELSVVEEPSDVSITNQFVMEVNTSSELEVGDIITIDTTEYQDFNQNNRPSARILDIIDGGHILIQMIRGKTFEPGQNIDNRFPYGTGKAAILSLTPNSLAIVVDDAGEFSEGDFIGKSDGTNPAENSFGVVSKVSGNTVYLLYTGVGETIDYDTGDDDHISVIDDIDSITTIENIIAPTLTLHLDTTPTIAKGSPIVSEDGGVAQLETVSGSSLRVTLQDGFEHFNGGEVRDQNPYDMGSTVGNINSISFEPTFYFYRGEYHELHVQTENGQDIEYSFPGSLPQGLEFDSNEMMVSGTLNDRQTFTSLQVQASNPLFSTSTNFNVQIYSPFGLTLGSPEGSSQGYDSYILHKAGKGNRLAPCRVTGDQIQEVKPFDITIGDCVAPDGSITGDPHSVCVDDDDDVWYPTGGVELDCFLEAGESDLYRLGMNLELTFPQGMCAAIKHTPYSFYQNNPEPESNFDEETIYKYVVEDDDHYEVCELPRYSEDIDLETFGGSGVIDGDGFRTTTDFEDFYLGDLGLGDQVGCLANNGGSDYSQMDGNNCDESQYTIQEYNVDVTPFECFNQFSLLTDIQSAVNCLEAIGTCEECDALPPDGFACEDESLNPTPEDNATSCITNNGFCESCSDTAFVCQDENFVNTGFNNTRNCVRNVGYCDNTGVDAECTSSDDCSFNECLNDSDADTIIWRFVGRHNDPDFDCNSEEPQIDCENFNAVQSTNMDCTDPNGCDADLLDNETTIECNADTPSECFSQNGIWSFTGRHNDDGFACGDLNGDFNCNSSLGDTNGYDDFERSTDVDGCPESLTQCLEDNGEWTFTGTHNDDEAPQAEQVCGTAGVDCTGGGGDATRGFDGTLNEMNSCFIEPGDSYSHLCGGTHDACLLSSAEEGVLEDILDIDTDQTSDIFEYLPAKERGLESNILLANYFHDRACRIGDDNNNTIDSHAIRRYSGHVADGFPNMLAVGASPVYRYSCLNGFGDELAAVNLFVREWNSEFSSDDPIDIAYPTELRDGDPVDARLDILHGYIPEGFSYGDYREITNYFFGIEDYPLSSGPPANFNVGGSCGDMLDTLYFDENVDRFSPDFEDQHETFPGPSL